MNNTKQKHSVLYIRVTFAGQHDQIKGIAEQRAVCASEAGRLGAEIIDEFTDTGSAR
jgi:hypothetical protein